MTTTTTSAGFFSFGNLEAGTYRIREIQPVGYLDGREQAGNLGGTAGNDVIDLTFSAAQYGTGYTFGELAPARLSGHVYNDLNDNGLYEYSLAFGEGGPYYSGEPALAGVIVVLTGVDDLGASQRQTATTSGLTGDYAFSGLRPGAYTVSEQQPSGYADGKDTPGCCVASVVSNDQFRFEALAAGADAQHFNFGERRSGIAGTVRAGPYSGIGGAVVRRPTGWAPLSLATCSPARTGSPKHNPRATWTASKAWAISAGWSAARRPTTTRSAASRISRASSATATSSMKSRPPA